jgi:hypothetical protein
MMSLAALFLGSSLMVTADAVEPPPPDPRALKRVRHAERHRRTMVAVNTLLGVGLELGSALFYAETGAWLIGRDVDLPSDGCHAASKPCYIGTPVVLLFPVGAIGMGAFGATRLAAAREAAIWRSPVFWAGVGVQLATLSGIVAFGGDATRNQQLYSDTAFIAGSAIGTVMQVWGALTAPPRNVEATTHALRVAPACGPTAGGAVCGLALAGF